jgi:esterase FrsA
MKLTDFPFEIPSATGARRLTGLLGEPDDDGRLAPDPALLLTFAMSGRETMTLPNYDLAARLFVGAGHRALSFDLPSHGERVGPGQKPGIEGIVDDFAAGRNPFAEFVDEARAAIDAAERRGIARPGRVFAYGVSRGGYCATRLAAADQRVPGAAGIAPVTDWRVISEFAPIKDRPEVAALALDHFAEQLVGRAVYHVMNSRDERVGTECCARFAARLYEAEARHGVKESRHAFHFVSDAQGHAPRVRYYAEGARFLLDLMNPAAGEVGDA